LLTIFCSLPVRELAERIRTKKLEPVELTDAYLERLENIGPKLGAVVTVTSALARKEAQACRTRNQGGEISRTIAWHPVRRQGFAGNERNPDDLGSCAIPEQVFDYDATVIDKLRAAGAVLVAKLAMVELAGGFGYNNADARLPAQA